MYFINHHVYAKSVTGPSFMFIKICSILFFKLSSDKLKVFKSEKLLRSA